MKLVILLNTLVSSIVLSSSVSTSLVSKHMEEGEWETSTSPFVCKLSQTIAGFGTIQFVKKPQHPLIAAFRPADDVSATDVSIASVPSVLKLKAQTISDGYIAGSYNDLDLFMFKEATRRFLETVDTGNRLFVKRQSETDVKVAVYNSIFGHRSVSRFRECMTSMSPLSWSDARFTELTFTDNQTQLTETQHRKISALLAYLPFDSSVSKVLVDGHSDNAGSNLANRMLSQERADEVAASLLENGLPRNLLEVRAHGNRYPRNENDRSLTNKRVTVRLVRKID